MSFLSWLEKDQQLGCVLVWFGMMCGFVYFDVDFESLEWSWWFYKQGLCWFFYDYVYFFIFDVWGDFWVVMEGGVVQIVFFEMMMQEKVEYFDEVIDVQYKCIVYGYVDVLYFFFVDVDLVFGMLYLSDNDGFWMSMYGVVQVFVWVFIGSEEVWWCVCDVFCVVVFLSEVI